MKTAQIGVIIPVYDQPRLVARAIESVLAQTIADRVQICVISDGGELTSQAHVLRSYAFAHDAVTILWSENEGPGQARNTGIEHLLEASPDLEAVFFLDADNRLEPWALETALGHLRDSKAGWIYSDIHMFGINEQHSVSGSYNPHIHLFQNYCDSGCLVSAEVLRAGVRFNPDRRDGFEDWGFWLSAISAGFEGKHVEDFGFRYRRRGASRFLDEISNQSQILKLFQKRHAEMYAPSTVKALETRHAPRFCLQTVEGSEVFNFSDPFERGEPFSQDEARRALWRFAERPDAYGFPPYIVCAHPDLFSEPAIKPFLRDVFLRLDHSLREHSIFVGHFTGGHTDFSVSKVESEEFSRNAGLVAIKTQVLLDVIEKEADDWLFGAIRSAEIGAHFSYEVRDDISPDVTGNFVVHAALAQMLKLGKSEFDPSPDKWLWKMPDLSRLLPDYGRWSRTLDRYCLPDLQQKDTPSVGFVIRICDFGGAEKVIYNVAEQMARRGWRVSLFIFGNHTGRSPRHHFSHFENIFIFDESYLNDVELGEWGGKTVYRGEKVPASGSSNSDNLLNALSTLDIVVNAHSWTFNLQANELRKRGVVVASYLHLVDHTVMGRPSGHPYVSLAFEYGYDLFISCSQTLFDWMGANGVPAEKLCHVRNAPGFSLDAPAPAREPVKDRPLRVLYAGRLDRQKGLDRLISLYHATEEAFDWRVIGGGILQENKLPIKNLQPPIYDEQALEAQYEWADIMVLLSDYEGVPLAILEAQRAGCCVVCTDVGGVREAIDHGRDGFMVGVETAAEDAERIMLALNGDRDALAAVSGHAQARIAAHDWAANTTELLDTLERKLEQRQARDRRSRHAPDRAIAGEDKTRPATA